MASVVVRVPWVGSSGTVFAYLPLGHVNQLRKGVVSVGCAHNYYYYYSGTSYGLKYVTKYIQSFIACQSVYVYAQLAL